MGFHMSKSDNSLFVLHNIGVTIYVLIYVDDIILTGSNEVLLQQVVTSLSKTFSLKYLGLLHYFLGIEVHRDDDGLFLSQSKYIQEVLHDTKMQDCKGIHLPMSTSAPLLVDDGAPKTDGTEYRSVLGKLQYLSLTRPDIIYAVNKLTQFNTFPSVAHWQAVKRLLRYLKETFLSILSTDLATFSYTKLGDINDRRSISGYIIFLGITPISWCSRKQPTVSRCSTEAEYRAVASALNPGNSGVKMVVQGTIYGTSLTELLSCRFPLLLHQTLVLAIADHSHATCTVAASGAAVAVSAASIPTHDSLIRFS
ncbi:uncharacterized mitochondrial protein AtMg00810-like [Solanum verrucosum]|uniref:uncharacterized mitochondrial protein AtMg00810-like n=1 Tax=Solanum verrucosum TaxID=315347 RepID=UPI0020D1D5BA|nr:uncharacterized mitochondrial protein AtMg00810-like [Solanum verrucosum]